MKISRFFAAVVLMTTIAVLTVSAQQQRPAAPAGGAAANTSTAVAVPDSKMAVIYSDAFQDPKEGIKRFSSLLATLNREFQPRQTELDQLSTKINNLTKEISDTQSVADPKALQTKADQLDAWKKEHQRKLEDAQQAYQKRRVEIFAPLQEDIGKALEAFAKAKGITVIVDASQMPVVYVADSIDVTKAFINDFNSKNPATAAVTQP